MFSQQDISNYPKQFATNESQYSKELQKFSDTLENIFLAAGYRPHTAIHPHRFPLIGNYENWERLSLEITHDKSGRIPEKTNDNKKHVLDVLLAVNLNSFNELLLPFVPADLFTMLFIKETPANFSEYDLKLSKEFRSINAPIYTLFERDPSQPQEVMTIVSENDDKPTSVEDKIEEECLSPLEGQDLSNIVQIRSQKSSIPYVVFDVLSNKFGDHHENQARKMIEEAGGLVYNPYLIHDRAPDGYYLCNKATLDCLEEKLKKSLYTFYGLTRFFSGINGSDRYVLVALEAKLTINTLQGKLKPNCKYFLFFPAPEPIRHLALVDGGSSSRAYITLINLCILEALAVKKSTSKTSRSDDPALVRAHQIGQALEFGDTLIVYLPSLSPETIRDLLCGGNNNRYLIKLLHELIRVVRREPSARKADENEQLACLKEHYQKALEKLMTRAEQELCIIDYQPDGMDQTVLRFRSYIPTLDIIRCYQYLMLDNHTCMENCDLSICPQSLKLLKRVAKGARKYLGKKSREKNRQLRFKSKKKAGTNNVPINNIQEKEPDKSVQSMMHQIDEPKTIESNTDTNNEDYKIGQEPGLI